MKEAGRCEKIFIDGEWYILCSSVPFTTKKLTIKDNRSFLITDAHGDVPVAYPTELGFYYKDTRHLSGFEMLLNGSRPLLLFSGISEDGRKINVELTNTDFKVGNHVVQRTSLYIKKTIYLRNDTLNMEINIKNLSRYHLPLEIDLSFYADFMDIFEVRGTIRERRGEPLTPTKRKNTLTLKYRGLDNIVRKTVLKVSPPPSVFNESRILYCESISPRSEFVINIEVKPYLEKESPAFLKKAWPLKSNFELSFSDDTTETIFTRAKQDIGLMISQIEGEIIPMAGIPWYCAVFGRDSLITSYELLPWLPDMAKGTLKLLARYQADDFDDFTDREPGKILHELREGEMANTREVPFIPYYGSVDATPWFIILSAEYVKTTADVQFIKEIWQNIENAALWIEKYGDLDGDGFLEYKSRSPLGLRNQGWKDSHDAIHHRNGEMAEPPIAVVEAQAYKYKALLSMAELYQILGDEDTSKIYMRKAEEFKKTFNKSFWMENESFYCLALDKNKKQCQVISSNPGHCLFAGIVPKTRAAKVVKRLLGEEMFSGYGIRTLSKREILYNPMSYHNGSVWAHDCALIVEGFTKYGFYREALKVFESLLEACGFFQDKRMPELFCGFDKEKGKGPVPYPVACSPQAWASGSLFLMLKSLLGLTVNAFEKVIYLFDPVLPRNIKSLEINNWEFLEEGVFSLRFINNRGRVTVEPLKKPRDWKVIVVVK